MSTNESYSFLAGDQMISGVWAEDPGSHTKHERNVKARPLFHHIFPFFDDLGAATGNFEDNSLQPMLHFQI